MARKKLTKKQRTTRNRIIVGLIVGLIIFVVGFWIGGQQSSERSFSDYIEETVTSVRNWWDEQKRAATVPQSEMPIQVHVLDVGQGSATLLQSSDGTNILIDSGRHNDDERKILTYLDQYIGSGGSIDLLILTHNHSDHIGYSDEILNYYQVSQVWMNGLDADSDVYLRVLEAVEASGAEYKEPKAGDQAQVGPFAIEVLYPTADLDSSDQNRHSIATRISANGMSIVQTGDAYKADEETMLEKASDVKANVLIVGHHGSNTSSSKEWVQAVNPDVAVYSAGANNSYGHPHGETLTSYEKLGIPLYGTDVNGSMHIYSDEYGTFRYEVDRE